MSNYQVILSHNEFIEVEADNENEAIQKAYKMAEANCFWDEVNVEEVEEEK